MKISWSCLPCISIYNLIQLSLAQMSRNTSACTLSKSEFKIISSTSHLLGKDKKNHLVQWTQDRNTEWQAQRAISQSLVKTFKQKYYSNFQGKMLFFRYMTTVWSNSNLTWLAAFTEYMTLGGANRTSHWRHMSNLQEELASDTGTPLPL